MSFLLLSNWFERNGFEVWKLKTLGDWLFFLGIVIGGFFIFWLISKAIKRNRTPEKAAERVAKKLTKLGGKDAKVYRNIVIRNSREAAECEMLWLSQDNVHLVKVFSKGTQVKGQMGSKNWTIYYNEGNETVLNPLIPMGRQKDVLNYLFVENHLGKIPINYLVVFADTYSYPHIKIMGFGGAVAYRDLRKWRKEHPMDKEVRWKRDRVKALLDQAMEETETNRVYLTMQAKQKEENTND